MSNDTEDVLTLVGRIKRASEQYENGEIEYSEYKAIRRETKKELVAGHHMKYGFAMSNENRGLANIKEARIER